MGAKLQRKMMSISIQITKRDSGPIHGAAGLGLVHLT